MRFPVQLQNTLGLKSAHLKKLSTGNILSRPARWELFCRHWKARIGSKRARKNIPKRLTKCFTYETIEVQQKLEEKMTTYAESFAAPRGRYLRRELWVCFASKLRRVRKMFNSQKINNDPWEYVALYADGSPQIRRYRTARAAERHAQAWEHAPRPEYDNSPNPILTRFREYVEERTDAALYYSPALVEDALTAIKYHEGELAWERGADEGTDELFGALRELADNWSFTEHAAHIAHARKVLTRLAAL